MNEKHTVAINALILPEGVLMLLDLARASDIKSSLFIIHAA